MLPPGIGSGIALHSGQSNTVEVWHGNRGPSAQRCRPFAVLPGKTGWAVTGFTRTLTAVARRYEVGDLVPGIDGSCMVMPPERCGSGHRLAPGHVLVGTVVCSCGERRHLTWLCDCGLTVYGPPLGLDCSTLNGPAAVRG
jgi:hypothetical protein